MSMYGKSARVASRQLWDATYGVSYRMDLNDDDKNAVMVLVNFSGCDFGFLTVISRGMLLFGACTM